MKSQAPKGRRQGSEPRVSIPVAMSRHSLLDEAVHGELSLAEWFALPEDERGELVGGHLVAEEEPSYAHEILVILLGILLRGWFVPRGGFVGGSDAKLAVGPKKGRRPDLRLPRGHSPAAPQRHHRPTARHRHRDRLPHTPRRSPGSSGEGGRLRRLRSALLLDRRSSVPKLGNPGAGPSGPLRVPSRGYGGHDRNSRQ
jgi:hypothetical protein